AASRPRRSIRSKSLCARCPVFEPRTRRMGARTPQANSTMKHQVTVSTNRPQEAAAEFRIGVRSVPYLADHGFQDMVVLPGSFYVEMALCVEHEISKRLPGIVRNVTFHRPVILSAD